MMPAKGTGEPKGGITPDVKRAQTIPTPLSPTLPTPTSSRTPPGTLSPRSFSIERKVAEQRKKL